MVRIRGRYRFTKSKRECDLLLDTTELEKYLHFEELDTNREYFGIVFGRHEAPNRDPMMFVIAPRLGVSCIAIGTQLSLGDCAYIKIREKANAPPGARAVHEVVEYKLVEKPDTIERLTILNISVFITVVAKVEKIGSNPLCGGRVLFLMHPHLGYILDLDGVVPMDFWRPDTLVRLECKSKASPLDEKSSIFVVTKFLRGNVGSLGYSPVAKDDLSFDRLINRNITTNDIEESICRLDLKERIPSANARAYREVGSHQTDSSRTLHLRHDQPTSSGASQSDITANRSKLNSSQSTTTSLSSRSRGEDLRTSENFPSSRVSTDQRLRHAQGKMKPHPTEETRSKTKLDKCALAKVVLNMLEDRNVARSVLNFDRSLYINIVREAHKEVDRLD